ncbi:carbon-monoxide dehydrogenase large subunit [Solimonas aquatica]|uniref:Carbon-monoxide dehydrogenase large subunit n=1 Tax=Solimonas aquatica TaxID=489703 RepID=A0A1H9A3M2_9GAMM|nr:xanthine dehydrogenase family protein molybdopterin-binding subunit [Solimonas aquatica]SEP70598.1 carbon-monoxide dehydrogenase large subunit [Solimonas aquatica]
MNDAQHPPQAGRYIGQRVERKEDARLLTGRGVYVDDVSLPGMLHVAFVRSPIARGRIRSLDASPALALPGVYAVYTAQDLARFKIDMLSFFLAAPAVQITPLASGRVAYVGDPVALVIAQNRYIAEDAAGLVQVDYEEETPVVGIDAAREGALVHPDSDSNIAVAMGEEHDEAIEALLAQAPHVVSTTVHHQRVAQSPIETRGVVVAKHGEGELTVYLACQSPQMAARYIAQAFGLPPTGIRVISKDVGGSFGLKVQPWREEIAVIAAGLIFGRPLKWIEDRLENLTASNQARDQQMRIRAAFDNEGRMLAAHSDYDLDNGAYPHGADCNIAVSMFLWAAYKMPQFNFYTKGWFTNTVGLAAYRGPWAMESLARETLLDIAARQIGIDPIEIRRRNLVYKADQPRTTPFGIPLEDITPAECLELLLQKFDVAAFRAEQAQARKQGRYLGLGFAAYIEPTAGSAGISVLASDVAQIRIEPTGKVSAVLSTHSQGHGTQTTMAQVIAETLGVPLADVSVHEDDSSRGGFGAGASGSRQAVAGGGASIKAAELLRDKLRRVAAHLLETDAQRVRIENGRILVDGEPEKSRSLREIAEVAYGEPERLPEGMEAGLEAQYRYRPPPLTLSSAAHLCVVDVSADTGFVKILRWISSEDCGVMINPAVVEGQIAGGLAQAIGTVLLEHVSFDARGNPTAVTYKDYMLPAISDVPDFEYHHLCTPSQSVGGFRGVGEGGCIVGPPTLVNAIADALSPFGAIPLDLPLTPSKLLEVIEGRSMAPRPAESAPVPVPSAPVPSAAPAPVLEAPPVIATQTRIDGIWKLVLATPIGPQKFNGNFVTDGDKVSGTLDSDMGSQAFSGVVEGNRLRWDLKVTKPVSVTLKYDVLIEGDKLSGKVKMGIFGNAKLTGERG